MFHQRICPQYHSYTLVPHSYFTGVCDVTQFKHQPRCNLTDVVV